MSILKQVLNAAPGLISSAWNGIGSLALAAAFLASTLLGGHAAEPPSGEAILGQLKSFATFVSVLHVGAHPDDENTQLITYLARGRGYRTAYLSLTRGDGGQNLLGPEFREQLGVARTQELLAARRLDGGQQFFTRAVDFGFSKDYKETLGIWDQQAVLGDIVRVIRTFRPDVIITRFSPEPANTHGHHTASAYLAVQAFKLAGDPKAFPEQLGELTPWQPKRILQNSGVGGDGGGAVEMDVGGMDPILKESFASIAARSRAMHKTQGFGLNNRGGGGGSRVESFLPLGGEPATNDILDGIEATWSRVAGGGDDVRRLADQAIARFKTEDPAASLSDLLALRSRVAGLPSDPVINDKRRQLDHIIQDSIGLAMDTQIDQPEVAPGEAMPLRHTALVRSTVPVRWVAVRYPSIHGELAIGSLLSPGQLLAKETVQTLPATTRPSQPYWLEKEGTAGLFHVDDLSLVGRPENPPSFPVEYQFEVGGQTFVWPGEPKQPATGPEDLRRHLDVIPPVSIRYDFGVRLFAPGATRPVVVELTAARANVSGFIELAGAAGWSVTPAQRPFHIVAVGGHLRLSFQVTSPAQPAVAKLQATVTVGGQKYNNERIEIRYSHIPAQLLQPPATLKAVSLNLAIRGHQIGYIPGAGDDLAGCLAEMGYSVTSLTGADLTGEKLREFDAVVIGVRAFNTRTDLAARLPALYAYVEGGGNVVAQYNRPDGLNGNWFGDLQLRISSDRVTDENAEVTFLAPDHPALTTPNKITPADFQGWAQEQGIYYPSQWDARFTPILASHDPGEAPLRSGLLVAKLGKGYFVYSSLVWFRELPEGAPGAWRLFANLVSLGK